MIVHYDNCVNLFSADSKTRFKQNILWHNRRLFDGVFLSALKYAEPNELAVESDVNIA